MRSLLKAAATLKPTEFAARVDACAACGFKLQVRLRHDETAVRCARCGASAITQSQVDVLVQVCADLRHHDTYELSAQGPLVRWLRGRVQSLTTSEYFDDVPCGSRHAGTVCQDVQHLTFADESFDLCTSTEVFEHVEDDLAGFREILRVLRPGGLHVFTVPLNPQAKTIERTEVQAGRRVSVLPNEFHADRFRGQTVFCYRNYGADIADRLTGVGFVDVDFRLPRQSLFGYARHVIVARKPVNRNT
jgi:SAM-dependent methyltransferase